MAKRKKSGRLEQKERQEANKNKYTSGVVELYSRRHDDTRWTLIKKIVVYRVMSKSLASRGHYRGKWDGGEEEKNNYTYLNE